MTGAQRLVCVAGAPSLAYAAVVFMCGWLTVSPFATWSNAAWAVPALPAVAPFVAFVITVHGRRSLLFGGRRQPWETPSARPQFQWRAVLDRRAIAVVVPVGVLVAVSFVWSFIAYRGAGEIIDGRYVLTNHGNVLETVTRREWLEVRTDESRVITGHPVLFGLIGQMGLRSTIRVPSAASRPESVDRIRPGRPGGPRRHADGT